MNYFLVKTEPATYSIEDFAKEKVTTWSGVKNPQAVQVLKSMQRGDRIFIYHSGKERSVRGCAVVVGNSRPDPSDPKSWLVDFRFVNMYKAPFVTLQDIRESGKCNDFALLRQPRLSVMSVPVVAVRWFVAHGVTV